MRLRPLGDTGLALSELTLGTMTFGPGLGAAGGVDERGARELVAQALDAGVTSFDTADIYSLGEAERLLGRALGTRRDEVVLATKAGIRFGVEPKAAGAGRAHLTRQLEDSLRRLGTDRVELFYVHVYDETVPPEELGETLDGLVRAGKTRYVAASNFPAWRLMQALALADARGWARHVALQALWNPLARDVEDELVPLCRDQGLGVLTWSPLVGGLLSGKYRRGAERPPGARVSDPDDEWSGIDQEQALDVVEVLAAIGAERGASVAQVALAWQLARPWVTSVVLGARRPDQLADNLGAAGLELDETEVARIDAAAPPPRRWPAWHIALEARRRDDPRSA